MPALFTADAGITGHGTAMWGPSPETTHSLCVGEHECHAAAGAAPEHAAERDMRGGHHRVAGAAVAPGGRMKEKLGPALRRSAEAKRARTR